MWTLLHIILGAFAVMLASYIIPGVMVDNFLTAAIVGILLAVVGAFLGPILLILTLPVNIATLGLFTFVIIGFLVFVVDAIVPGFQVDGFFTALLFALVLVIVNSIFEAIAHEVEHE